MEHTQHNKYTNRKTRAGTVLLLGATLLVGGCDKGVDPASNAHAATKPSCNSFQYGQLGPEYYDVQYHTDNPEEPGQYSTHITISFGDGTSETDRNRSDYVAKHKFPRAGRYLIKAVLIIDPTREIVQCLPGAPDAQLTADIQ